ncbi:MAG TPA: hypothetical protein VM264_06470 [Acidimicrobiales bacterium]|nr:hypothetical protein [Acidimicrobiales bacterium]
MELERLTPGERVVAGAGTLLAFDLLFLPWHRFDLGIVVVPRTAVQWPFALLGVPALLLTVAMVAVVTLGAATDVTLPARLAGWRQRLYPVGVTVAVLLGVKLLVLTSPLGYGAYLGMVLAAAVAYGGHLVRRESGGPATPPPRAG